MELYVNKDLVSFPLLHTRQAHSARRLKCEGMGVGGDKAPAVGLRE